MAPGFDPPFAVFPRLIGHRGAASLAPENTLASVRAAAEAGMRWIEIDARLAGDGVPVLMHDDTLERTTNATGATASRPSRELAGLDAGSWFAAGGPDADRFAGEPVPTLAQCLALCRERDLSINIEIKPDKGMAAANASAVLEVLDAEGWGPRDGVLISSFQVEALRVVRDDAPAYRRGLLIWRFPDGWREAAAKLGVQAVISDHNSLETGGHVARIAECGWVAMTYTVNDAPRARRLYDWGVAGMMTGNPAMLRGL